MELYIHVPFCVRKCAYCDFLSGPSSRGERTKYVQALLGEMRAVRETVGEKITSVYIGGGTPSLLEEDLLALLLKEVNERFYLLPGAEFTMECNPGTLGEEKLAILREWGVNRLSLGLQSPRDEDLRLLGRIHTYQEFLQSYTLARRAGFANIGIDLMYGLPGQKREHWAENLDIVASLGPEHLSCYCLAIEEGTPFSRMKLDLPDDEVQGEMFEDTAEILKKYSLHQYEFSNYARPGFPSRHNVGYWTGEDYLGVGLGAASLIRGKRFSNTRDMSEYLSLSRHPAQIRKDEVVLAPSERMSEYLFLGLRLTRGISLAGFEKSFGVPLMRIFGEAVEKHRRLGMLTLSGDSLALTRQGILVSNQVLCDFLC